MKNNLKPSIIFEQCLDGIVLNTYEKEFFDEIFYKRKQNSDKTINEFFKKNEIRYINPKKHSVELEEIKLRFKKKL